MKKFLPIVAACTAATALALVLAVGSDRSGSSSSGVLGARYDAAHPLAFGVTEDTGKGADAGVSFFATLKDVGFSLNRVSIPWDPANPTVIPTQLELDAWVPVAAANGVRVIFAVQPGHARDITSSPAALGQFTAFLQLLARAYPQVKDFVVVNEPNLSRFWQPQFNADGSGASGAAVEAVLAQSYDALKAVDPSINVIGLGLSPRGNDNADAPSNISTSPVRFIHDLGAAYRASGRTKPLMDDLAFHPYPNVNTDPLARGYLWPNAGLVNLDRIKQAVWDAFHGTAQPTFAESGRQAQSVRPLGFILDETGWQVGIPSALLSSYFGAENVPTIDENAQAQIYADAVKLATCDTSVDALSFFHLVDEANLDRWQSGLIRVDGSKRPAYDAVKNAIAQTGGRCTGRPTVWGHVNAVTGASARFFDLAKPKWWKESYWGLIAGAKEEATYRAGIFRLPAGARPNRAAVGRTLAAVQLGRPVLSASGIVKANLSRLVRFPSVRLRPGRYYYGIRLAAAMNPERVNVFVSTPFRVAPRKRR